MKRTYKYALSAVLTAAMVAPAFATDDNFPDTPANHWAFEALARMKKEGLLVGYPDGLYRGGRPASRYEMACAVNAVYAALRSAQDGLDSQMKTMEDKFGGGGGVSKADWDNLKAAIDALKSDVAGMKAWGDDIAALKKMAGTFEKELSGLGVDVEQMKKTLGNIGDRVTALEKNKMPINIGIDADLLLIGGYSTNDQVGITVDGRPTGAGRDDNEDSFVGATTDLSIFHEMAVNFSSNNDSGPKFKGTLVIGNMMGSSLVDTDFSSWNSDVTDDSAGVGFGQAGLSTGVPFAEAPEEIYVQNLSVMFDTSISGLAMGVEAGRVGYKISPYILQRPDNTPYHENSRWDDHMWYFDGAVLHMKMSNAKVDVFAGRNNLSDDQRSDTDESENFIQQRMYAGQDGMPYVPRDGDDRPWGFNSGSEIIVERTLGVNVGLPIMAGGNLNLSYLWLRSDDDSDSTNGVNVYGGDISFNAAGFGVNAGYSKSDVVSNNTNVVDTDNYAYWVGLTKDWAKWGADVAYKYIAPQFAAPGDWGRIGAWWNPTDIKGIDAKFHFDASPNVQIRANAGMFTGTGKTIGGNEGLLTSDDIQSIKLELVDKLSATNEITLGYENVIWRFDDPSFGGNPTERWFRINFRHQLGKDAFFKFGWEISDYDSNDLDIDGDESSEWDTPWGTSTAKGGIITTQIGVKFNS